MIYVGGGFVTEGAAGYAEGEDVVDDYDLYDWEFDLPLPEGVAPAAPGPRKIEGEAVPRREQGTREHPQFAKKYDVAIDVDKLREALEWLVTRSDTPGAVRSDDIYNKTGEVAGKAFWVGFGPDVKPGAIHDGLHEAFRAAGVDVAQTLIGADNLRRGLERKGGIIKQAFFRVFVPAEGWKLLQDWTILREEETKADVRPELQELVRDRQRARRLEIIEALKDIRVAEVHAAELAQERAAREAAEERAAELARELERQDRALAAVAAAPRPVREALTDELSALFAGQAPADWQAGAARARERLEHPPAAPPAGPPAGWQRAAERAMAEAAQRAADRDRQRPVRPLKAAPAPPPPPAKPAKRSRPTSAERQAARVTEIRRLQRRARYLETKAGTSRSRVAREARAEAKEHRAEAERLKSKRR